MPAREVLWACFVLALEFGATRSVAVPVIMVLDVEHTYGLLDFCNFDFLPVHFLGVFMRARSQGANLRGTDGATPLSGYRRSPGPLS